MSKRKIIIEPDPILRKVSEPLEKVDNELRKLMDDMLETMYSAPGIGLAAVQIGILKRLIVIDISKGEEKKKNPLFLINPIITAFNHDTHRYADSSMLEHRMQLAYETVKYARGFVNNINPKGFGDIHYDNDSSDIAPSNFKDRAFVDGTLRDTTATDTTDFFSDNVIGTIKEQDLIYETNNAIKLGVFGVPTIIINKNLFWGNDQMEHIELLLKGKDPLDLKKLNVHINKPRGIDRKSFSKKNIHQK